MVSMLTWLPRYRDAVSGVLLDRPAEAVHLTLDRSRSTIQGNASEPIKDLVPPPVAGIVIDFRGEAAR